MVDKSKLLKLLDRERAPGVGHDLKTLSYQEAMRKTSKLPDNWREKWKDNHRFFHRQWQMIGSHSQAERYDLYKSVRSEISYSDSLEDKSEFRRWLLAAQKGLPWNLASASGHMGGRKIPAAMENPIKGVPMFISRS